MQGPRNFGLANYLGSHGHGDNQDNEVCVPPALCVCSLSLGFISSSQHRDPEGEICCYSPQDKAFTLNSFLRALFMSLFLRQ